MPRVLVTGASGYVGGRLVPLLLEHGHRVRCLARRDDALRGRTWAAQVEVVRGDVLEPDSLRPLMEGIDTAFYLVHSMHGGAGFHDRDRAAARSFAESARAAGVRQVIYLGGLGDPASDLSRHLRSRQEVGDILRAHGPPVTEFRAAVIVGAGSVSFEMIRYLTERLPVLLCPRWISSRIQPVAVDDVLAYLTLAIGREACHDRIVEIGGADVLTYGDLLMGYARVRGLRRWIVPVPLLTPWLASLSVHWVTPVPASIARPLILGLRNEVIVRDSSGMAGFPEIRPMGYREALERALGMGMEPSLDTHWTDALSSRPHSTRPVTLDSTHGLLLERRRGRVEAPAERVFSVFSRLGGTRGWLYADWAWRLRGRLDRALGGVGLRRGRRHPDELRQGDVVDFWRVELVEPGRRLRLRAEMWVPGLAWQQFEAIPDGDGSCILEETAFFHPHGLSGLLYWYLLYPVHAVIFAGLFRRIKAEAER